MIHERRFDSPPPPAGDRRTPAERWKPIIQSTVSTAVVLGLLVWLVTGSEGWPAVRKQFFDFDAMRASAPKVLRGFLLNLEIWVIAGAAIFVVALVIAIMRSASGAIATPFRWFAIVFIDVTRGIPALLLMLLFGFGIPALQLPGVPTSKNFWGTIALVVSYSGYTAEVYRSGMDAVHHSQRAAAKALGLSQWQTLRFAILPQAIRNVLPALLNLLVALQKDVALLSIIGVRDAVREAQIYTARTFNYSSLIVAAGLFLVASVPLARFTDWYAARDAARRLQGRP